MMAVVMEWMENCSGVEPEQEDTDWLMSEWLLFVVHCLRECSLASQVDLTPRSIAAFPHAHKQATSPWGVRSSRSFAWLPNEHHHHPSLEPPSHLPRQVRLLVCAMFAGDTRMRFNLIPGSFPRPSTRVDRNLSSNCPLIWRRRWYVWEAARVAISRRMYVCIQVNW